MFPTFVLTGFGGGESTSFSNALNSGSSIWSVGLGVTMPLLDWGVTAVHRRRDRAPASGDRALPAGGADGLSRSRRCAVLSAPVLIGGTGLPGERRRRAPGAAAVADTLRRGYSPYLEVLDAQRQANLSEIAALRNRQALLSATVDLMKSLGGGWTPDQLTMRE